MTSPIPPEKQRYAGLINNLVMTTDGLILGSRRPWAGFGVQGERSRVCAIPLAWSAALRVSHNVVLQASIEYVVLFSCLPFNRVVFLGSDEAVSVLARDYGCILTNCCTVRVLASLMV